ncbi:2,5-diketo-D-gluconate reductase A [Conyzicola lurida]|uniref:2,5-diketo-D-gluconate reductase A n=1 Tax=Conyzicola lurida TaxID=1172621 RepID=A0A841ARB0_9MICO|nr:aldo/keto reductase [Conyzicola lurida]MBB5844838.1 2,5-diketo-D-gluconate reductase A [Conyzicola lurida]
MVSLAPRIRLNDGHSIPQIGLGTWPLDDDEVASVIVAATGLGYRHIDTAAKYGNETGVGAGIAASGLARDELFVTTKLDGQFQGDDRALAGLDASLQRLKLDYVDLLLIHWPLPGRDEYVSTFRTFAALQESGKARSIGVSNFKPAHLERLVAETGITPAVNQIELNPYVVRAEQRAANDHLGIVTESWSPLGPNTGLLTDPRILAIAGAHDRTPGQIVLRWHVQQGLVAIPKSRTPERLADNLEVFDFELTADELATIAEFSEGPDAGVDSDVTGH